MAVGTGALIAAGVGAAANIGGSIAGGIAAGDNEEASAAARAAALQQILGVYVPTVEEQRIALQQYVEAGELTPEQAAVIQQDPSAMEQIATDPRLRDAQMKALSQMQGLTETGYNMSDKLALAQAEQDSARSARGRDEAILQNMAERGVAGGGQELAARMMSSQNQANSDRMAGLQQAAVAQQRALEAMAKSGQMGGDIRSQEFGEASAKAQATDAISRFNAQNRQNVLSSGVDSRNAAQAANLKNQQNIMNSNVDNQHKQEIHNKDLYQQRYDNEMKKAQAASGQYTAESKAQQAEGDRDRAQWAGIGSAVGSAATGIGGAMKMSDEEEEKDKDSAGKFKKYGQNVVP